MPHPLADAFLMALLRSPLHPLLGDSFAVITVTGRKTGRPFSLRSTSRAKGTDSGW